MLKKGHSEQDKMERSIVVFVASMLQRAQEMMGKFLSPVSTRGQICFVFALQTNVAFVLKMSLFQFGFSRKTRKKHDKEDAETGPQAKEKRLEEAQPKSLGKAKASDEDTKPRGRKISHGSYLRRRKTRCIISCLNAYL